MYFEINEQQNLYVNKHFIPTHEKPRNGYSFVYQINVEKELGLNPFEHGVVSMIGVGVTDENPLFNLEPVFNEFIPKKE